MKDLADDLILNVRSAIAYIKELEAELARCKQVCAATAEAWREEAALAEPVQEPVAVDQRVVPLVESALQAVAEKIGDQCAVWYGIGARDVEEVLREAARHGLVHAALAEPAQEPVASIYITPNGAREFDDWRHDLPVGSNLLYTSPPQRKPLTREEVDQVWESEKAFSDIYAITRAIERAHGIGEQ
jgi:hypothetical protein